MFKKWWVLLIQGIIMLILGIYILNNPVEMLAGISLWIGILILFTGILGIFGWIFAGKEHRDTGALIWSLLSVVFGLIILGNLLAAMKAVTVIFGIWILVTGFSLLSSGWKVKKENSMGWFLVIVGILSLIAGIMMITNMGSGAAGVRLYRISGYPVRIALIILSFAKKMIVSKVEKKN
ncbi:MAG: DUF308 domain-containing protein [Ignavibacteria bacterium]|nr:DUF308 domain-containing protein [Ignavibacteria bacterium]